MWKLVSLTVVGSLLFACSKKGDLVESDSFSKPIEAQFIDDPVKGLKFVTSSGEGFTAEGGKFDCIRGEGVEFWLGSLHLGSAICGNQIFVDDVVPSDLNSSPEKIAALIQSFAIPGADGLDLTPVNEHLDNLTIDFSADILAQVTTMVATIPNDIRQTPKDPDDMRAILDQSIANYSNISSNLKSVLEDLAVDENEITLRGSLKTGNKEICLGNILTKVYLYKDTTGPVQFANSFISLFNSNSDFDEEWEICEGDFCVTSDDSYLFLVTDSKSITSDQISFMEFTDEDYFSYYSSHSGGGIVAPSYPPVPGIPSLPPFLNQPIIQPITATDSENIARTYFSLSTSGNRLAINGGLELAGGYKDWETYYNTDVTEPPLIPYSCKYEFSGLSP